jgi:hypothetical protein
MSFSGQSIDRGTTVGPGTMILLSRSPKSGVQMMAVCPTIPPTGVTLTLEGSLDGLNWATIGNASIGSGLSNTWQYSSSTARGLKSNIPVTHARANIVATDGTPCSAWIALDPDFS